jgi:plastocyanin
MKNVLLVVIAVVVLIGAGYVISHTSKSDDMKNMDMATATPTASADTTQGTEVQKGDVSVSIANFAFAPDIIKITKGSTITWTNNDTAQHSVISSDGNVLSSKPLASGETYSHTFNEVGTISYHCGVHPFMTGTIQVVE